MSIAQARRNRLPRTRSHPRAPYVGGLLIAWGLVMTGPAYATVYNDGGTHTISGADSDVGIGNGTTVNVVLGAIVTGTSIDPFAGPAIRVHDNSVLNVSGGSIRGGDGSYVGGSGVDASGPHFNFSGGSFVGGDSSGFFENRIGGHGADIRNFQSLSVSGGTFVGGLGWPAGSGMRIGISGMQATAYISGGDFYSGDSPYGYVYGAGLAIHNRPAVSPSAVISGGTFNGGLQLYNATVNVTGGWGGASELYGDSIMDVGGAFYVGPLRMHNNSIATLNSGYVDYPDFHENAVLNMRGGFMTGGGFVRDNAVVNLTGGHFGRLDSPNDFSQQAVLNVYGTGLTYQNQVLHGILQDGTPLDATIRLFDNAVINLYQIPEPSGLLLAAFSLVGLAARGWRRKH